MPNESQRGSNRSDHNRAVSKTHRTEGRETAVFHRAEAWRVAHQRLDVAHLIHRTNDTVSNEERIWEFSKQFPQPCTKKGIDTK